MFNTKAVTVEEHGFKQSKFVDIPEEFGNYHTDVAVDLGGPKDTEWKGIAIDHHPDHPIDRKYTLYWDHCPTGLVLYNNLKEHMDKKITWLVVGSLMGDGQVELTPNEIWDTHPELLVNRGAVSQYNFKTSMYSYPLFGSLSSGINSLCRLGQPDQALQVLMNVDNPIDLIENTELKDAQERMRAEKATVYKNKPIVEAMPNWTLVRIKTSRPEVNICGLIGAELMNLNDNMTFIIINETNGTGSIRGNLAKYICNKLNEKGFKAGGHSKFCGCSVEMERLDEWLKYVRSLRIGQA